MTTRALMIFALLLIADFAAAEVATDLDIGGEVRMRGYDLENMWDADSDQNGDRWSLFRQRTRLHLRARLDRGVTGFVRIANQHWGEGVTDADAWEADNKSNKLFVDAAWIDAPRVFDLPVSLRFGRQSVMYGSGFILFDGQSQTASTSTYLDGVRAGIDIADAVRLDLLYFKDQENVRTDAACDDITIGGAYFSWTAGGDREAYVLRRRDEAGGKDIAMVGARLKGAAVNVLDYEIEGAVQRGDAATGRSQDAWGCKSEFGWTIESAPAAPRFFVGFTGMSGDDPSTHANERWDVFYGGWPQFGDLLAWTNLNLGPGNAVAGLDPGYATGSTTGGEVVYGNMLMPSVGLEVRPRSDLGVEVSYSPMRFHQAPDASDDLGIYAQLHVKYRYSPQLAFALYAAMLEPGEAYGPDADTIHEVFWEASLTF